MTWLTFIKILIALLFLARACLFDLKERVVPNRIWREMLLVFIPLNAVEYFLENFNLFFAISQFAFMFFLCYSLYYLRLYGGADAKAIIMISLAFPVYPTLPPFPILNKGLGVFAFSTLANSVLSAPVLIILFFLRNLLSKNLEFPYCCIGYKVNAKKIPKFHNLLEYVENGKVKKSVRSIEPDDKIIEEIKKAAEKGIVEEIWVTPGFPFLCFITAGFILSVVLGDLVIWMLSNLGVTFKYLSMPP